MAATCGGVDAVFAMTTSTHLILRLPLETLNKNRDAWREELRCHRQICLESASVHLDFYDGEFQQLSNEPPSREVTWLISRQEDQAPEKVCLHAKENFDIAFHRRFVSISWSKRLCGAVHLHDSSDKQ